MNTAYATSRTVARAVAVTKEQEEWASFVTHGVGLLAAVAGAGPLLARAAVSADPTQQLGLGAFALGMVLVYAASTLYHGVRDPQLKDVCRVADHAAIYLMIAGTYTPLTLRFLSGGQGALLFGVVWGLALAGIVGRLVVPKQSNIFSTVLYMAMGWSAIVAGGPLLEAMPSGCLALILLGGLWYTLGVAFYMRDDLPYAHAIWHLFVMAGTVCHYLAIWQYVA